MRLEQALKEQREAWQAFVAAVRAPQPSQDAIQQAETRFIAARNRALKLRRKNNQRSGLPWRG